MPKLWPFSVSQYEAIAFIDGLFLEESFLNSSSLSF